MNVDPAHATAYIINPLTGRKVELREALPDPPADRRARRPPASPAHALLDELRPAHLPFGAMSTEADVRRIALSLPETIEKPWYGTPGFRVKDKGFLRIRTEAEGGLVVFVADLEEKEALLASEPKKFFTTPHYDGYSTVLVNLKAVGVR